MKLAIIILNWNAAADTNRCVRAIQTWQHLSPTIYVVDNDSHDMERQSLALTKNILDKKINFIQNETNLGFAGGNNVAIREAIKTHEFIFLLNNDAMITEADLMRLIDTFHETPPPTPSLQRGRVEVGLVGTLLYSSHDHNQLLSAGGRDIIRHLNSHVLIPLGKKKPYHVDYIPGTAILIRSIVFQKIGLLDENYFFSGEIADLCMRAKLAGYQSVINPMTRAEHNLNRSAHQRQGLYIYYVIRNRFLFIHKFYSKRLDLYMFWLGYSVALFLKMWLGKQTITAHAIRLGLQDGLQGRFGGQNERILK